MSDLCTQVHHARYPYANAHYACLQIRYTRTHVFLWRTISTRVCNISKHKCMRAMTSWKPQKIQTQEQLPSGPLTTSELRISRWISRSSRPFKAVRSGGETSKQRMRATSLKLFNDFKAIVKGRTSRCVEERSIKRGGCLSSASLPSLVQIIHQTTHES